VSEAYNIELSSVRSRSLEIEHIPDDPPERISGWLTTVSDAVLRALDVQLLCDLVIVETDADRRQELLDLVVGHIDELVSRGEFVSARHLVEALERQAAPGGAASPDPTRRRAALAAFELLVSGEIMARIATQLNGIPDEDTEDVKKLCLAIGPALIPRLADALAAEQRPRARQRMTDWWQGKALDRPVASVTAPANGSKGAGVINRTPDKYTDFDTVFHNLDQPGTCRIGHQVRRRHKNHSSDRFHKNRELRG
jgi:hypothetical protein